MKEKSVIIRFANEDESYVSIDAIKTWDIELVKIVADTYFCKSDGAHFSIKLSEYKRIPFPKQSSKEHYRPLPKEVGIRDSKYLSDITGRDEQGLFADEVIPAETKWMTHVKTDNPIFEDGLIRLPMGGFFNHNSNNPNCFTIHTDEYVYLVTLRDIEKGEELTAKYTLYDPEK